MQSWSAWAAEHADEAPLAVGSVIRGRFVLEQVIGAGGMGQVYRALDRRREEAQDRHPYVAIKVLSDEFKGHPDALKALHREARKTQKLAHPNIGTVFDFDRDGSHVYLVMELLEGEPLNQVIKAHAGTGVGHDRALRLIDEMGIALSHAHSKGIVHSDFKPSNVFLTNAGEVKVIDFGIARAARTGPGAEDISQTVFDAGKLGAATLAYASPEQLLGVAEPDPRDDVYSLGVVAYELLAGRHPYDRRSALEAQLQDMKVAPVPDLTEGQNAALRSALAFNRDHRPATVNDFMLGMGLQTVLRNLVTSNMPTGADQKTRTAVNGPAPTGGPSSTASHGEAGRHAGRRTLPIALGIVAALLLGGGIYGYQVKQQGEAAQRQAEERERRAAEARIAEEQRAREAAEQARLEAEARASAEAEARARAERDRLRAEVEVERERLARERADRQRTAAQRVEQRTREDVPTAQSAGTAATTPTRKQSGRADPKPGTMFRWKDESGEVHYGTQVPPQYADSAVPILSSE